tara:strand:+ start:1902 stop:3338 length:1437 start_codon:yes stop_codon:yes gene_type:complete
MNAGNLSDIKKRFLQLHPVNASSGGQYSFRGGLPIIKFDISASEMPLLMNGGELRISGKLSCRKGDGTTALVATENNFIDGWAGINQFIDIVTISSKRLNTVIERVSQYSRLIPSLTSGLNDQSDYEMSLAHGDLQHSTIPLTRHGITALNGFNDAGTVAAAAQRGQDFSCQLYTGVLQSGQMIDLSNNSGVGGLVIEILLKSDANCIFGSNAATDAATYNLSDLVLTVPVYEMHGGSAQARQSQVNAFSFNSWQSMFQTINSSTSVVAFTPGLSRVAGVVSNYITASDLGNQNFNACRLGNIGELQAVRWAKNGALFPLNFRAETVEQQNNNTAKQLVTDNASNHIYSVRAEPLRYGLEAVSTDRDALNHKCMNAYSGWSAGCVDRPQNAGRDGISPGSANTLSILYDAYGAGVNFQNTVWSSEINTSGQNQLRVNDTPTVLANNLDGTAATAQAIVMYFLSKNTIMMSAQGIDLQR